MAAEADYLMIAERLRTLAQEGGSVDAAQVRLIGLDDIRAAAGDRWPRMREKVRNGSMEILSRFLRPDDVVIPAGDGFLIMLASGPPGYAQKTCLAMREALLSFYLGDEALAALRAEVSAHAVTADGFADLLTTSLQKENCASRGFTDIITRARLFAVRPGKVAAQVFAPMLKDGRSRRLAYNPDFVIDGRHRGQCYAELDCAIRDAAFARAESDDREQPIVGLTVHASTMQQRRSREAYLAAFADAPAAFRASGFVTIAEIERGTPLMSIAGWCASLRAHVSRVGLDFHYTDHAVGGLASTGAWAAGFHLPISTGAQTGPRARRTLDQVKFWARTIRGQNLRLAVNGFQSAAFLEASRQIGVDIVSSDALWPFGSLDTQAQALAA